MSALKQQSKLAGEGQVYTTANLSDVEVLLEIGSIGAGNATVALSNLLHELIRVEVPRLHMAPPHLVPKIYKKHDTTVAAVFMQLRGSTDCDLMVVFDIDEAKKIAALMMDSAGGEADASMENSAIVELGSIMLCSFLSAMANFASTELVPGPPQLILDDFDAIIDGLLVKQALCSERAAVFDTSFRRIHGSADGCLIMFPSAGLQTMLTQQGKKLLETDWPTGK
jgi:chemotaxis protein CheC